MRNPNLMQSFDPYKGLGDGPQNSSGLRRGKLFPPNSVFEPNNTVNQIINNAILQNTVEGPVAHQQWMGSPGMKDISQYFQFELNFRVNIVDAAFGLLINPIPVSGPVATFHLRFTKKLASPAWQDTTDYIKHGTYAKSAGEMAFGIKLCSISMTTKNTEELYPDPNNEESQQKIKADFMNSAMIHRVKTVMAELFNSENYTTFTKLSLMDNGIDSRRNTPFWFLDMADRVGVVGIQFAKSSNLARDRGLENTVTTGTSHGGFDNMLRAMFRSIRNYLGAVANDHAARGANESLLMLINQTSVDDGANFSPLPKAELAKRGYKVMDPSVPDIGREIPGLTIQDDTDEVLYKFYSDMGVPLVIIPINYTLAGRPPAFVQFTNGIQIERPQAAATVHYTYRDHHGNTNMFSVTQSDFDTLMKDFGVLKTDDKRLDPTTGNYVDTPEKKKFYGPLAVKTVTYTTLTNDTTKSAKINQTHISYIACKDNKYNVFGTETEARDYMGLDAQSKMKTKDDINTFLKPDNKDRGPRILFCVSYIEPVEDIIIALQRLVMVWASPVFQGSQEGFWECSHGALMYYAVKIADSRQAICIKAAQNAHIMPNNKDNAAQYIPRVSIGLMWGTQTGNSFEHTEELYTQLWLAEHMENKNKDIITNGTPIPTKTDHVIEMASGSYIVIPKEQHLSIDLKQWVSKKLFRTDRDPVKRIYSPMYGANSKTTNNLMLMSMEGVDYNNLDFNYNSPYVFRACYTATEQLEANLTITAPGVVGGGASQETAIMAGRRFAHNGTGPFSYYANNDIPLRKLATIDAISHEAEATVTDASIAELKLNNINGMPGLQFLKDGLGVVRLRGIKAN